MPVSQQYGWIVPGAPVRVRGESWRVSARVAHADCEALQLIGCDHANWRRHRTVLLPFDRPSPTQRAAKIRTMSSRQWRAHVRRLLAASCPHGALASAQRARIDVVPFQLEPAIASLIHGALRLLIADEVGLGKTVQAGILLAEHALRSADLRAIVVMPAGLRDQWRTELHERFGLDPITADIEWLAERTRDLPPDVNPWALPGVYLASIDFVKRAEVLRALADLAWDVFVLDEAHCASIGTDRLAAARTIGRRSRRVVLLSATPPYGDSAQLRALSSIGSLDEDEDLVVFRRTRADTGGRRDRKSSLVGVRLSAAERRMHRRLDGYVNALVREPAPESRSDRALMTAVLRKRALSSARSLALSVRRRLDLLMDPVPLTEHQLFLPLDEDALADGVPDDVLSAPGLADAVKERHLLEGIAAAAEIAATAESKVRCLVRLTRRAREPLLVFTEYRDTLAHLARTLAAYNPLQIHGGMSLEERRLAVRAFQSSGGLLLATDAASEGLNLHQRCRVVVHFELPWTPARLEQRTGRVDRFGQTRRVHEIMLVARHTAERTVVAPLVRRIRSAGGEERARLLAFTESTVAAAVLGRGNLSDPTSPVTLPGRHIDVVEAGRHEAERLRAWRRLTRRESAPDPRYVAATADARASSFIHVLVRVAPPQFGAGAVREILHVRIDAAFRRGPRTPQALKSIVRELRTRFREPIIRVVEEHLQRRDTGVAARMAVERREQALEQDVARGARPLVQPGLFDRRAVLRAESRAGVAAAVLEEGRQRRAARNGWSTEGTFEIVAVHVGALA